MMQINQKILNSIPIGVLVTDATGRIEYVNPSFERISGYTAEDVLGKYPSLLKSGRTSPKTYSNLWNSITRGKEWSGNFINRRKNGTICYVTANIVPVHGDNGEITHYISFEADNTESEMIKTALDKQGNLLSELGSRLPGVILQLQQFRDGRIAIPYASAKLSDYFNCDPEDVILDWEPFFGKLFEKDRKKLLAAMDKSMATICDLDLSFRVNLADDQIRWYAIEAVPEELANHSIIWHGYLSDVTEKMEIELEIKNYTESIRNQNLILRKAQYEAGQAAKAKRQFLANMSHEIRTPMNAVIGATSLIEDTELSDEQKEYLEIMKTGEDALMKVINNILDFDRMNKEERSFYDLDFDIPSVVDRALASVKRLAFSKSVGLVVDISETAVTKVRGDPETLAQILINLAENAVKFTHTGEIHITLDTTSLNEHKVKLKIAVQDTGIGIDPDKHEQIFEAFYQVDGSYTRLYGGTGLGLTITEQLVQSLGGTIFLNSELEKGSTFTVEFPCLIAPSEKLVANKVNTSAQEQKPGSNQILLVEDDETNLFVTTKILSILNLAYKTASNGKEALEILRDNCFDLILMDCQMPVMDGFETTRLIRQSEALGHQNTPIIAMTALALDGDRERCIDAGMNDYMPKPIKLDNFEAIVLKWFPKKAVIKE